MKTVKVKAEIEIPEGATHYIGNIAREPNFFKSKEIGVVGTHWFEWRSDIEEWVFSHTGDTLLTLVTKEIAEITID